MQPLTEILFEETFLAQQKYERFSTLYGAKSDTSSLSINKIKLQVVKKL